MRLLPLWSLGRLRYAWPYVGMQRRCFHVSNPWHLYHSLATFSLCQTWNAVPSGTTRYGVYHTVLVCHFGAYRQCCVVSNCIPILTGFYWYRVQYRDSEPSCQGSPSTKGIPDIIYLNFIQIDLHQFFCILDARETKLICC